MVAGAEYEDINKAITRVKKTGLQVLPPEDHELYDAAIMEEITQKQLV
uniref:Uncharacterized protein n=1 Tax=Cyanothece sp. (strain PCC 7425 / ATCC 29141) TaxID=395961 RepID=B8HN00_CYAP4